MGGIASVLTQAVGLGAPVIGQTAVPMIAAGLNTYMDAKSRADDLKNEQQLALSQLKQRQTQQEAQLGAQNALNAQQIEANSATDRDKRMTALRRAVARQRAQFGASGIGNQSAGSGNAVLLGMFDETAEELAARETLDNIRKSALDMDFANAQSVNVLQRTQLAARQQLARSGVF